MPCTEKNVSYTFECNICSEYILYKVTSKGRIFYDHSNCRLHVHFQARFAAKLSCSDLVVMVAGFDGSVLCKILRLPLVMGVDAVETPCECG